MPPSPNPGSQPKPKSPDLFLCPPMPSMGGDRKFKSVQKPATSAGFFFIPFPGWGDEG
jgi:hypothetical protein